LQIKNEIDSLVASWIRVIDHHVYGEPPINWTFWKNLEQSQKDKVQEYYSQVWIDGLLNRIPLEELMIEVAGRNLFTHPQPVAPLTQQEIDAATERRRLAAEKRGVKPSDRHAIRRNHIIENESGDIPIV
jgi:hypothetical protein